MVAMILRWSTHSNTVSITLVLFWMMANVKGCGLHKRSILQQNLRNTHGVNILPKGNRQDRNTRPTPHMPGGFALHGPHQQRIGHIAVPFQTRAHGLNRFNAVVFHGQMQRIGRGKQGIAIHQQRRNQWRVVCPHGCLSARPFAAPDCVRFHSHPSFAPTQPLLPPAWTKLDQSYPPNVS